MSGMRFFALLGCVLLSGSLLAQSAAPVSSLPTQTELRQAFEGDWVGVLEYRDYSEPASSTKRVQLPTWLSVSAAGNGLVEHFVYDDGPTKTVQETETVRFDPGAGTYTEIEAGKAEQVYRVAGFEKLKSGRGELVLTGMTTDNDKPAESRVTLTIRRNLLSWTEEVRAAGSGEGFVFRHRFTFTRAGAPVGSAE